VRGIGEAPQSRTWQRFGPKQGKNQFTIMKLPILIIAAAVALPASGWSREIDDRRDRNFGDRMEESSRRTGNMLERGLLRIHDGLTPLGRTLKKESRDTERTIRKTDDRMEGMRDGIFDRENDGLFR
jgi:hypothetical protein